MNEITDTTSISDIVLSIGTELFGKDEDTPAQKFPVAKTGSETPVPQGKAGESGTSDLQVGQGNEAKPGSQQTPPNLPALKPLPKSWKKDMEPHWAKLDPAVHEYVHSREADVMRGIQMYQSGHDSWSQVISPFSKVMEQNPGVNPVQLLQNLMHSHLSIVYGTPEQKVQIAQKLLQSYGIQLPGPDGSVAQPDAAAKKIQELEGQIRQLQGGLTAFQAQQKELGVNEKLRLVQAFFSDPKNEYAEEVAADIARFLQSGAAPDLPAAYELACYANPSVRAKILAKQQTDAAQGQPQKKPPKTIDDTASNSVSRTRKADSWEQEVDSIVQSRYSSH